MDDTLFVQDLDDSFMEINIPSRFKSHQQEPQVQKSQTRIKPKAQKSPNAELIQLKILNDLSETPLNDKHKKSNKNQGTTDESLDFNTLSNEYTKNDYIQMALHYRALSRSYKKQLIEAQNTIREMHYNLEMLEHNSKNLRKETNEEDPNSIVVEKCAKFCEKINDQIKLSNEQITTDEDSACPKEVEQETREEMIFRTMRYLLKERKETKSFFTLFVELINCVNPESVELNSVKNKSQLNYSKGNKVLKETLEFVNKNSLKNFHCKCNNFYDYDKQISKEEQRPMLVKTRQNKSSSLQFDSPTSCSSSSSSYSSFSEANYLVDPNQQRYRHKPTQEQLMSCVQLFQNLFDVDCFLNVKTKMNELYYKHGQLKNFRKAIQNLYDPEETFSIEKLIYCVQKTHSSLNEHLLDNLKLIFKSDEDIEKLLERFQTYDEYFPIFYKLLNQIMKSLEITRLDQIMPSLRALKILATPTIS